MEAQMHRRITILATLLIVFALVTACGSGKMSTRTASQKLKPVEALPEREQSQMPVNLTIKIGNVANAASSYGNFLELFINGKAIAPEKPENNLKSSYRYNLRLQPGVYDVEAKYHGVGFWKERVFTIKTDEPVKIIPGQRTELAISLEKDGRGFLRQKKNQFTIRYAQLDEPVFTRIEKTARPKTEIIEPAKGIVVSRKPEIIEVRPGVKAPYAPPVVVDRLAAQAPNVDGVILQINTMPVGADIYVDDRFVGQSPVRVVVKRREGHVIQIARKGFQEHLKVLDAGELQGKNDLQIIVRLEKEE
jgi:hypothetical protein